MKGQFILSETYYVDRPLHIWALGGRNRGHIPGLGVYVIKTCQKYFVRFQMVLMELTNCLHNKNEGTDPFLIVFY